MASGATYRLMEDGKRLHLQHGPIDIVARAYGEAQEVSKAYKQAIDYFETVLQTLVTDIDVLQSPVDITREPRLDGIAKAMWQTTARFSEGRFVTPMAAVAGAVADKLKAVMLLGRNLDKIYVNNGGDIAVHLAGEATFTTGIVDNQDAPQIGGRVNLSVQDLVGGGATSGWRGRSLSPGIADAVTVLARNAAFADVAATLIAGDVMVESQNVTQYPAATVRDDTDLRDMLVTVDVGPLTAKEINLALERGLETARNFYRLGLIDGAYLSLQKETRSLSKNTVIQGRKVA